MKFTKYRDHGDYHWRRYDKGTKYRAHADRVVAWIKEKKILDIGCGDGKITSLLGATGIDNEADGIKLALDHDVDAVLGDAYALPFPDESFEAVLMADVLEHFEDPAKALAEARRVLTDCIYITTPPKRPDGKLTDVFHFIEWTPLELKEFVEAQGFTLEDEVMVIEEEKTMYAKFRKT